MSETSISPAQAYQTYFGPSIFGPLVDVVVSVAPPRAGDRVLDVACGTGVVARRMAEIVGEGGTVVGIDINPKMIEVARSISVPGGPTIEYREGDGTALDLPAASFDYVCCQQGLQFFPDRTAGAAEMRRVLAPGGTAVVVTWKGLDHHPLYAAMADAEEPHLGSVGANVTRAELEAPFSLGDPEELRRLLADAGFASVEIAERSIEARFPDADRFVERMEFAYAAVIPQFAEDPAAFTRYLDAITEDTRDAVAAAREGDEVVVPMHANIAVASA